jgi:hypothetical protein
MDPAKFRPIETVERRHRSSSYRAAQVQRSAQFQRSVRTKRLGPAERDVNRRHVVFAKVRHAVYEGTIGLPESV